MPAQLGPSQDCTSQCATKRPPQAPHTASPITVTVAPQHRQPGAREVRPAAAPVTPHAATTAPHPPLSLEAMQAHSRPPHVMCSMPYADSCGAQPGIAQWAFAGHYPPGAALDSGGHPGVPRDCFAIPPHMCLLNFAPMCGYVPFPTGVASAAGVYVVRTLAEPAAQAPAATHKVQAAAEKAPEAAQPELISSLLDHETASGPRPGTGTGHAHSKPSVDYASIYSFLGAHPAVRTA